MQYRVSAQAQREITEITNYIARDNPDRALSFVKELRERIVAIAEAPFSFRELSELAPGLRAARHGNYLIFFRLADQQIEILRVRHGAMDLGQLLQD